MANHKSALKRARQNKTNRMRNAIPKTRAKTAVKAVRAAADSKDTGKARDDQALLLMLPQPRLPWPED